MGLLLIAEGSSIVEATSSLCGALSLHRVRTIEEATQYLEENPVRAVVIELPVSGCDTVTALSRIQARHAGLPIVVIGSSLGTKDVVRMTQLGAFQVLSASEPASEILQWIMQAREASSHLLEAPDSDAEAQPWKRYLVGQSWPMRVLGEMIRLVAPRRCTVLITGETGSGKEMVARAMHACSPRGQMPMVAINCSALPEQLLEAELFGYVKGAFTGAYTHRIGRIEHANRSTLFLDEIGEMPMSLQSKLLRVLQEREFQPLGTSETVRVDIRVIAASNSDLEEMVRKGRFREDLYYRLNVAPIQVPPLRRRRSDVPLLVRHFVQKICRLEDLPAKAVAAEAMVWLGNQSWPGNVRQLENAAEIAVALSGERLLLTLSDFAPVVSGSFEVGLPLVPDDGLDYNAVVDQFERGILERALQLADGSKKRAAELLRLKRTTFSAKLKSLNIETIDADADEEPESVSTSRVPALT